jgi:hypothetical protein
LKTPDSHSTPPHVPGAGDPASLPTAVIGLAGAFFVFLVILVIEGGFYYYEDEENRIKSAWTESGEPARVRAEQIARISEYRTGDTGAAAIPIERAMELVVKERAAVSDGTEAAR